MSQSVPDRWRVEIRSDGRCGYISYYEGSSQALFYWEFGGGDIVAWIDLGKASEWSRLYPWAAGRQPEVMGRVIQEALHQRAPTGRIECEEQKDGSLHVLIRQAT